MPTYEFQCKKCSKPFEAKESFAEHDRHQKVRCPHCGSTRVEQTIAPVGVKTAKKS
jgi:putative FmdB family regulatory protein